MTNNQQPRGAFKRALDSMLWRISYRLWRMEVFFRTPIIKWLGIPPPGPMNDVELKEHAKLIVKLRDEHRISPFDVPDSLLALARKAAENDADLPAFRAAASIEAK